MYNDDEVLRDDSSRGEVIETPPQYYLKPKGQQ